MTHLNRAVLLACSERKRHVHGAVPAHKLYDGPLWQTWNMLVTTNDARRKRDKLNLPVALILSARYGFSHDGVVIPTYDQRMTPERAEFIVEHRVGFEDLERWLKSPNEIFLAGGRLYRDTMRRAIAALDPKHVVIEPSPARGIGDIRAALAAFVSASPPLTARLL